MVDGVDTRTYNIHSLRDDRWERIGHHFLGDRTYDSDQLDANLQQDGVNLITPHRSNRKAQDPGRSTSTALPASLACRTVLYLAPVEAARTHSLRLRRHRLAGSGAARIDHHAAEAIEAIGD